MKKTLILLVTLVMSFVQTQAQDDFFTNAGRFFNKYVENGLVDYHSIQKYPTALNELTSSISKKTLKGMDANTKKAYLINVYNILVIKSLVKNQPLDNPLNLEGFFDKKKHNVGGNLWTLNDIENKQLRPTYQDARLHFALVCGAMGCPRIISHAYTPDRLESKLEQQVRKAVNDPTFIKVDHQAKTVQISEIFYWYKDDFLKDASSLLEYINKYRAKKIPEHFKVSKYTYDWTWNAKKK